MTTATMTLPTEPASPTAPALAVTGVRLDPAPPGAKVLAFATVILNGCFLVADIRVIGLASGRRLVAMPCKKKSDRCPACRFRTAIDARFCPCCGVRLAEGRATAGPDGRTRTTWDVAYPVSGEARRTIEEAVLAALDSGAGRP